MSVFYYPVRGYPRDADEALRTRRPFSTTPDGRVYRPTIPVRVARADGLAPFLWLQLQIDTAADGIVLDGWVAETLGLERPADAAAEQFRTAAGGLGAWLAEVRLHLGIPTDRESFDWRATAAFAVAGTFPDRTRSGVLGIGGGLEQFLAISLVLSPLGSEMPSVTIFTP